jgi:choline monooxygenase
MNELQSGFSKGDIASLADSIKRTRQSIEQARGLPNAAYNSAAFFEFERDRLMAPTWVAIGFERELPAPGYVKPVDFMGVPLLIVRDREAGLSVFHNVCSHRGMVLVPEAGALEGASIRCPYHSWAYGLDGTLRGTPHIGGVNVHNLDGFDSSAHGLVAVRSHTWCGMVFVNLSGDAPVFEQFIAPLENRWREFTGRFSDLRATDAAAMELEVACNWKLAVENYCESYHLPWVHPGLNDYSPLDQHFGIEDLAGMSGQGTHCYRLAEVAGNQLPVFGDWPTDRLQHAEYLSLYPNVLMGLQADHVFAIILHPLAQDRTRESLQLFFVGDDALEAGYSANHQRVLEAWREVFNEDIFAVEGMQRGRLSPGFQGGVFSSAMDGPTHHFHRWVAEAYAAGLSAPGEGAVADRV